MEGEDSEFCNISIEPKSGDLGPREELELALYLTARKHVRTLVKITFFSRSKYKHRRDDIEICQYAY